MEYLLTLACLLDSEICTYSRTIFVITSLTNILRWCRAGEVELFLRSNWCRDTAVKTSNKSDLYWLD